MTKGRLIEGRLFAVFLAILFTIPLKFDRVLTHIFRHSCVVMWLVQLRLLNAQKKHSLGSVDKKCLITSCAASKIFICRQTETLLTVIRV